MSSLSQRDVTQQEFGMVSLLRRAKCSCTAGWMDEQLAKAVFWPCRVGKIGPVRPPEDKGRESHGMERPRVKGCMSC